jgi:methyltransferase (TIGR00027 family)
VEANQVSKTALGTAYIRAYHAAHDQPKIFDDFLAQQLIPREECQRVEERYLKMLQLLDPDKARACSDRASALAAAVQAGVAPPIVLGRARYAEDHLEQAIDQGVRQYVILGAGMDTFAWRRPDLLEQLQVFEVDHPATQTFKRRRLQESGREQPAQLHFVPADFAREPLGAALLRAPYNPQVPSFFSWLGVVYYLSRAAIFETLSSIAQIAPAGSPVIFDYFDPDAFVPDKASRRVQLSMEILRRLGEPMLTGFDPSELGADLARLGLRLKENLSPADIEARYFRDRQDDYHACEHAYYAWAVVR